MRRQCCIEGDELGEAFLDRKGAERRADRDVIESIWLGSVGDYRGCRNGDFGMRHCCFYRFESPGSLPVPDTGVEELDVIVAK